MLPDAWKQLQVSHDRVVSNVQRATCRRVARYRMVSEGAAWSHLLLGYLASLGVPFHHRCKPRASRGRSASPHDARD
jgi:hypothetical protein